jgi:hypothetical protein
MTSTPFTRRGGSGTARAVAVVGQDHHVHTGSRDRPPPLVGRARAIGARRVHVEDDTHVRRAVAPP